MSAPATLYLATARRTVHRYGVRPWKALGRPDDRTVFVVGSPRSGTSFTAKAIGLVPGFADLGEVNVLKAEIPEIVAAEGPAAAARVRAIVRTAQRVGFVTDRRPIEQTPESTYIIPALAEAFPRARFVHLVRDGRDVACSLIEKGWLSDEIDTADDAGQAFGNHARFWVEPERRDEFPRASEATRAAWVWRRYESTARTLLAPLADRSLEVRYEQMVADPERTAVEVAGFLDAGDRAPAFVAAFGDAVPASVGRHVRDLDPRQQADVVTEAGPLLAELGYLRDDPAR